MRARAPVCVRNNKNLRRANYIGTYKYIIIIIVACVRARALQVETICARRRSPARAATGRGWSGTREGEETVTAAAVAAAVSAICRAVGRGGPSAILRSR